MPIILGCHSEFPVFRLRKQAHETRLVLPGYEREISFNSTSPNKFLLLLFEIRGIIYTAICEFVKLDYLFFFSAVGIMPCRSNIQGVSNMTGTQCGLFTLKSVPVMFESPCNKTRMFPWIKIQLGNWNARLYCLHLSLKWQLIVQISKSFMSIFMWTQRPSTLGPVRSHQKMLSLRRI
jgi:hypothetical protein